MSHQNSKEDRAMRVNYRTPAVVGLILIAILLGAGGVWATFAKVGGAIIASGAVGISGKPKTIQHLDGGIVERILIEAGQTVKEGENLIELDDKTILANLAIYKGRLRDLLVRKQRLLAELDDKTDFTAPTSALLQRYQLGSLDNAITQQQSMLQARRNSKLGEIAQLAERIAQFNKQIGGVQGLKKSKKEQLAVFTKERAAIEKLVQQSFAAKNQLLAYDRSFADFAGQIAEHDAEIGRLNNSISEVEISKLQVDRTFREKVISELDEIDAKVDELTQQVEATEQQFNRTVIRAPVAGIIHELSIFTIGGVVQAGQPIMQIVPMAGRMDIEVNVETQHIDQLLIGQKAVVRFPAFNQRTTPEIFGSVARVSPTSIVDEKSGFTFYRVGIEVNEAEMKRLGDKILVPGMPVETVIPTSERTVLEYLIKPLSDNLTHVFREE
jgi:HlyD family secretion protein